MKRFARRVWVLLALLVPPAIVSALSMQRSPAVQVVVADYIAPAGTAPDGSRRDVGGLSGAWYDRTTRTLWAVSDDTMRPRLVVFDLPVDSTLRPTLRTVIPLSVAGDRRSLNLEGLAPAAGGAFFVVSDGSFRDPSSPRPGIYKCEISGACLSVFRLPAAYMATEPGQGLRNAGLHALSVSPTRRTLFAAVETSLQQDGPEATLNAGAVTRIMAFDLTRQSSGPREYAYRTEPLWNPPGFQRVAGQAGVLEILAISDSELLVVERVAVQDAAAAEAARTRIGSSRLYRVRLAQDAAITGRAALDPSKQVTARKELVIDLADVRPQLRTPLQSVVGFGSLTLGPELSTGGGSLLLINDDGFDERGTGFVQLRWPIQ